MYMYVYIYIYIYMYIYIYIYIPTSVNGIDPRSALVTTTPATTTCRCYIKGPPEYCQDGTVTHLNYNRLL